LRLPRALDRITGTGHPSLVTRVLLAHSADLAGVREGRLSPDSLLRGLIHDADAASIAGVNRHEGVTWISKEGLERLAGWLRVAAAIPVLLDRGLTVPEKEGILALDAATAGSVLLAAKVAGYRVDRLLGADRGQPPETGNQAEPPRG
jgi:hypothetical protein